MHVVTRRCSHSLLTDDGSQRVARHSDLAAWAPSRNLGAVVKSVVDALSAAPPAYEPEGEVTTLVRGAWVTTTVAPVGGAAGAPSPAGAAALQPGRVAQSGAASTTIAARGDPVPQSGAISHAARGGPAVSTPVASGGQISSGAAPVAAVATTDASLTLTSRPARGPILSLPPVRDSFDLSGLAIAELQRLLEDENARAAILARADETARSGRASVIGVSAGGGASGRESAAAGVVAAARASALDGALANAAALTRLEETRARVDELEVQVDAACEDISLLQVRLRAARERLLPEHVVGALDTAAAECDRLCEATFAFLQPPVALLEVAGLDGGTNSASAPERGSLDAPSVGLGALHEFRDEFVPLRRRAHALRVASAVVRVAGIGA